MLILYFVIANETLVVPLPLLIHAPAINTHHLLVKTADFMQNVSSQTNECVGLAKQQHRKRPKYWHNIERDHTATNQKLQQKDRYPISLLRKVGPCQMPAEWMKMTRNYKRKPGADIINATLRNPQTTCCRALIFFAIHALFRLRWYSRNVIDTFFLIHPLIAKILAHEVMRAVQINAWMTKN